MKIREAFTQKKALIAFLTCGDPDIETTEKIIVEMEKEGVDLIELGIPFSDPMAEGPIIQAANMRALANSVTTNQIFAMVKRIRSKVSIPLVFMTYANVVYSYGTEAFIKTASELGMNGLILPDVPFEEKEEFSRFCDKYNMDFISLIAPTSENRIQMIAKEATGFLYCVSSLGVTGVRTEITLDVSKMIARVREVTNLPVAIGFGISTSEQAKTMAKEADGIIIGSAIVKQIETYGREVVPHIGSFVNEIKNVIIQS